VHDDKMDVWKRRRQDWFMQGKEGKQYKANSFYQFLRRLGFFPTEVRLVQIAHFDIKIPAMCRTSACLPLAEKQVGGLC